MPAKSKLAEGVMIADVLVHHVDRPRRHIARRIIGIIVIEAEHVARFVDEGVGIDLARAIALVHEVIGSPEVLIGHRRRSRGGVVVDVGGKSPEGAVTIVIGMLLLVGGA